MLVNIEAERVRHQYSKEELASKIGVSYGTYKNWVYERTDIPASGLLKLSKLFNVDIEYLLAGASGAEEKTG